MNDIDISRSYNICLDDGFMKSTSHVSNYLLQEDDQTEVVPLWLVTFTDTICLMLTFFVMLYAMSVPQEKKWEEVSASLSADFNKSHSKSYNSGPEDVISVDKVKTSKALDLSYLKTMIAELLQDQNLKNIVFIQREDTLILSLPSDLIFRAGTTEISEEGKRALFTLSGVLSNIRNRLEIVGHTDPRPLESSRDTTYANNWELSLARAIQVASLIRQAGYNKNLVVRGVSSGRYGELPAEIEEADRYSRARRVDIVVMNDSGRKLKLFE